MEKGTEFNLNIMDSSGLKEHKAIRQTMYKQADAVIFCFSLAELKVRKNSYRGHDEEEKTSSTMSLNSIRSVWLPEVLEVIKNDEEQKEANQTFDDKED